MHIEQINRNKEALERYFHNLASIATSYPDTASSIFELNSSAYGRYVREVLQSHKKPIAVSVLNILKCFFLGSARLWARVCCLYWMKYYFRGIRQLAKDRQQSKTASTLFIGHVAQKNGQFAAKDFTGFIDRYLQQHTVSILGQRLPHIRWRDYLTSADFVPIEAHIHPRDVATVWVAHTKLLLLLLMRKASANIINEYMRDFSVGRGPNATLYAHTATRLVLMGGPNHCQLFIPLERHDWECLTLYLVKRKHHNAHVSLVQNCTFSLNDCNMYILPNAPAYRRETPDHCYVIDKYWQNKLIDMGLSAHFEIMDSHRFSNFKESIKFDHTVKKILYLGSINPEKVQADFKILAKCPQHWAIDIRLHPSLSMIAFPKRFRLISDIFDTYAWCIHADTSMAVFLQANADRFIYIDHPNLLNQNPLPSIGRQGKSYTPDQLLSILEQ